MKRNEVIQRNPDRDLSMRIDDFVKIDASVRFHDKLNLCDF